MWLLLTALAALVFGALAPLVAGRRGKTATVCGGAGAVLGGALALSSAAAALLTRAPGTLILGHGVSAAILGLKLDAFGAALLLPLGLSVALAALFGAGAARVRPSALHAGGGGALQDAGWPAYNGLFGAVLLVVTSANAPLLFAAWETMSLLSLATARRTGGAGAGRAFGVRLAMTQIGAAALAILLLLLAPYGGWANFHAFPPTMGAARSGAFLLALLAFAGVVAPGWLSRRRRRARAGTGAPARPGSVADEPATAGAALSGAADAVVTTGALFVLLRAISMLGVPPLWWGVVVLAAGLATGLASGMAALRARDLHRLVGLVSAQGLGVVLIGVGTGLVGVAARNSPMALLGFAGVLLFVVARALFVPLVSLAADAITQATGTAELERLGGLLGRMRDTGVALLAGGLSAAGLPPLSGFAGVVLLIAAAAVGVMRRRTPAAAAAAAAGIGLLLVGGSGALALLRALRATLLGVPRTASAARAREVSSPLRVPMHLLAAASAALGLFPALALVIVARAGIVLAAPAGQGTTGAVDVAFKLVHWSAFTAAAVFVAALAAVSVLAWRGAAAARAK